MLYRKRTYGLRAKKGFTLIELLVVIAIIGVLSGIVLAALTTARNKGSDAAAKENLLGPRAQAELYFYANSNSYAGVCATTAAPGGVKTINQQVLSAALAEGLASINIVFGTTGGPGLATCHDSATGWGAEVPLKATGFFCVDNTGISTTTTASTIGASDTACGP